MVTGTGLSITGWIIRARIVIRCTSLRLMSLYAYAGFAPSRRTGVTVRIGTRRAVPYWWMLTGIVGIDPINGTWVTIVTIRWRQIIDKPTQ